MLQFTYDARQVRVDTPTDRWHEYPCQVPSDVSAQVDSPNSDDTSTEMPVAELVSFAFLVLCVTLGFCGYSGCVRFVHSAWAQLTRLGSLEILSLIRDSV